MSIKLSNKKTSKTTTGIYLEVALLEQLNSIAKDNGLSVSETMVQLIVLGLEKAGDEI
jgi:hypothetical protein|tara:strand:- start:977 stop:1150 length:174 start_codon:yes stop_codon:yes gene_type:complete